MQIDPYIYTVHTHTPFFKSIQYTYFFNFVYIYTVTEATHLMQNWLLERRLLTAALAVVLSSSRSLECRNHWEGDLSNQCGGFEKWWIPIDEDVLGVFVPSSKLCNTTNVWRPKHWNGPFFFETYINHPRNLYRIVYLSTVVLDFTN